MGGPQATRDRETDEETEIIDALVDRGEEGMTVLELRAFVDADIDAIEEGLTELKRDGLIEVKQSEEGPVIRPDERLIPEATDEDGGESFLDAIRKRLPF
jgi:ribosome assembly protein YihI (activator of Der GTPase)